ncbi:MAG: class I SAM-dependent methyltransferase [Calditrichaceae bacterium]|nr:class I SAM-dependent methyltransferase [Calditrichaceae bacterium]
MLANTLPYSQLALYYDRVMNHVDYKKWAKFIKIILSHYYQTPKNIVELACGTGAIFKYLKSDKWTLYGGDRSHSMLRIAYEKKRKEPCHFFCADYRNAPIKKEIFDVALILYDSVNYIIDETEITWLFEEVNNLLKNGGLFIFDVVSPYICKTAFKDYTEREFWGKSGYIRKSWFVEDESVQYNEFEIYVDSQIYKELHQQKIRNMEEWERLINVSPLKLLAAYHNFSLRKAKNKSERIHFVCRKLTSND